ncbi:hypothetical protein HMI54_000571 [Coelomomyces lativittatus]|nr:hypothetical protein HMI54_000571 [Coelomomyces lativittatus]
MRNPFSNLEGGGQTQSIMEDPCPCLQMTRKQRFIAFGICFVLGLIVSLLSTISLWTGQIATFAVFYSFGNLISLASSAFIVGVSSHLKSMFDAKRRLATIVFLSLLVVTLVVAFTLDSKISGIVCLLLCGLQFIALFCM